jgi:protein-tyrosine kinase
MEQIKQAVDLAKANSSAERLRQLAERAPLESPPTLQHGPKTLSEVSPRPSCSVQVLGDEKLNWQKLEQHRIVAHNVADLRSRAFDMLRTQVVQSMDQKNWHFLAVTSPTAGCGKSVTAINLALSIARQPDRPVLLIDMDLKRPTVANYLGLNCRQGLQGVLEGRTSFADGLTRAHFDGCELLVLPVEAPTARSSELIGSRIMSKLLQDIRRDFKSYIVIFDMPPILQSDEVIATLPKMDCVLLVTAVGISTARQIKECRGHLRSTEVVRLVLNKTQEPAERYYY